MVCVSLYFTVLGWNPKPQVSQTESRPQILTGGFLGRGSAPKPRPSPSLGEVSLLPRHTSEDPWCTPVAAMAQQPEDKGLPLTRPVLSVHWKSLSTVLSFRPIQEFSCPKPVSRRGCESVFLPQGRLSQPRGSWKRGKSEADETNTGWSWQGEGPWQARLGWAVSVSL